MTTRIATTTLLVLTAAAAIATVVVLASIGSTFAWIMAAATALFVAVVWAETVRLRATSGGEPGSNLLVASTLFATAMFMGFAIYLLEFHQRAVDCVCP